MSVISGWYHVYFGGQILWLRQCHCNCQHIYNPFEYCFQGICNVQLSEGILLRASKLHHSQLSTRVSLPTKTLAQDQKLLNLTVEGRYHLTGAKAGKKNCH